MAAQRSATRNIRTTSTTRKKRLFGEHEKGEKGRERRKENAYWQRRQIIFFIFSIHPPLPLLLLSCVNDEFFHRFALFFCGVAPSSFFPYAI